MKYNFAISNVILPCFSTFVVHTCELDKLVIQYLMI